ncbi:MAG: polyphosphate:AMP phosphotransferase [Methanomassiliicoccales archaeon]|nr:MAG: polyphosphate:AMP phosphotransferase [Methanomassiliicoccales archaeon]
MKNGASNNKEKLDRLRQELGQMQRQLREEKVPLAIIFEGLDYWGMANDINELIRWLDPRGFDFHDMLRPLADEKERPFIWRYFLRMPSKGRIAVFDRSWYFWAIYEHYKSKDKTRLNHRLHDIRMLERQHHDEGTLVIKFFLVPDKERKRNDDEKVHCKGKFHLSGEEFIDDIKNAMEEWKEILDTTNYEHAPWVVIKDGDEDETAIIIIEAILQHVLKARSKKQNETSMRRYETVKVVKSSALDEVDLSKMISEEKYKARLEKMQQKLAELQCKLYLKKVPSIIVFEGWDAAGKGGNILRLTASLNPRGYRVAPVTVPNDEELSHHYLWRFYKMFPKDGMMTIFDRSWYGRVLVERVEGYATAEQVERAYLEINDMERMLTSHGTIVIKFWLHIDPSEQLRRFKEREEDPYKRWKITEEDWRNRSKWDAYKQAVDDMISSTSTKRAPWTVIPSNDKRYSRIAVLEDIIERFEDRLD